jgi:hypothetical protein
MAPADAGHLVIGAAFGLLILSAYRYVWRQAPAVAAIMAIGIIARAAAGLTLFWISYLDLPILRGLHSGDGFWVFASDARYYYQAAAALSDGLAPSTVAPGFISIFSGWMDLVGRSPASGLFLNVTLYVLLCVLVVRACRPARDRTAQLVCAACLGPLSVAPAVLAHSSQPLKDDVFVFLSAVTCLSVLALLRVRADTGARPKDRWTILAALASLGAAAYVISEIRLYFAALVWACLIPATMIYVWRSKAPRLRWRVTVAIATLAVASIGPALMESAKLYRWIARSPSVQPRVPGTAPDRGRRGDFMLWEFALHQVRDSRLGFIKSGGASNIVADAGVDDGIARATLVGLATVFVPISIVKALGWVDLTGVRVPLWITDIDTMLLDVFILACVSLAVVRRDRIGPHVPYVWFVVSLALVVGLLLGYIVTNFGTLFRLRLMVAVPLWMLPLAVRHQPDSPHRQAGSGRRFDGTLPPRS